MAELLSDRPEQPQITIEKEVAKKGADAEVEAYMAAIQAMHGEISMMLSEPCALGGEQSSMVLVQDLVQIDTSLRTSAANALRHCWFQSRAPATPALTAHRSAARIQMMDIARAVARAFTLFTGIRGDCRDRGVHVVLEVVADWMEQK